MLTKIGKLNRAICGLERRCICEEGVRLGQHLKSRRQVGNVTKGGKRYPCRCARRIAHDDLTAGDTQPNPQRLLMCLPTSGHSLEDIKTREQRAFGIILVGDRITETGCNRITYVAHHHTSMTLHDGAASLLKTHHQTTEVLRIEAVRIFRRSHHVAEKNCQMTPVGHRQVDLCRPGKVGRRKRRDRAQDFLARAQGNAHFLEIAFRQKRYA